MKRFNKTKAEELVLEYCVNYKFHHQGERGLMLYCVSGSILDVDKVLPIHLQYNKFRKDISKLVSETFGDTPSVNKWKQININSIIKMSGIVVGGCYIGTNTYTLSYGSLENTIKKTYTF